VKNSYINLEKRNTRKVSALTNIDGTQIPSPTAALDDPPVHLFGLRPFPQWQGERGQPQSFLPNLTSINVINNATVLAPEWRCDVELPRWKSVNQQHSSY